MVLNHDDLSSVLSLSSSVLDIDSAASSLAWEVISISARDDLYSITPSFVLGLNLTQDDDQWALTLSPVGGGSCGVVTVGLQVTDEGGRSAAVNVTVQVVGETQVCVNDFANSVPECSFIGAELHFELYNVLPNYADERLLLESNTQQDMGILSREGFPGDLDVTMEFSNFTLPHLNVDSRYESVLCVVVGSNETYDLETDQDTPSEGGKGRASLCIKTHTTLNYTW
jgi:hypothetical protein